ncbi:MAG: hypothetical protein IT265_13610 [Saprospiraceae bacterium]|nr:hypothetical protein [Saprospiraceae bacterium]
MRKIIFFWILLLVRPQAQDLHIQSKDLPCVNKHFNLMIHIVVDSLRKPGIDVSTIMGTITGANYHFAPICASFSVCGVDTIHNYAFDSIEDMDKRNELLALHQKPNVINVYYVDYILTPSVCGLSGLGTLIKKSCPGSITHEFGHLFGLSHTFEGNGIELVNGANCDVAGDGICDTPSDPFVPDSPPGKYATGCEFVFTGKDANGEYYQPDIGNIMSYYGCDCGFTREQYLVMANTIVNSFINLW